MAEGGGLLNRYTGLNPYRGFESPFLRHFWAYPKIMNTWDENAVRPGGKHAKVAAKLIPLPRYHFTLFSPFTTLIQDLLKSIIIKALTGFEAYTIVILCFLKYL